MTCIVGIEDQGKVYMGADSCINDEDTYITSHQNKIFEIKTEYDQFLIGITGRNKMIDIVTYNFNPIRLDQNDSDEKFIRTTVIENLRKIFKDAGYAVISENRDTFVGDMLIGYKGVLYCIRYSYDVLICHKCGHAIGDGNTPARGSLWTTKDDKDPEKRILAALESAEAINSDVRGPMYIKNL